MKTTAPAALPATGERSGESVRKLPPAAGDDAALPTPFQEYAAAGFGTELLPILPPDASISPQSPARENLLVSRGKVPGRLARDGWFGFGEWTSHQATELDHTRWSRWECGMGMQGRKFIGLDIDVDLEAVAEAVEAEARSFLGSAPARSGKAARRLLVYRCPGLKKRRLAFRLPAAANAEVPAGPVYAVEILGEGQQYVVEGIHPKTGNPYIWRDGLSPAAVGAEGLTVVTAEQVDKFIVRVGEIVVAAGYEIVSRAGQGAEGGHRAGLVQDTLRAPSLDAVRAALDAIPNDEHIDYDAWYRLMAAVKAAAAGLETDDVDGFSLFADWSATSGKDNPDVTADKWASTRPPYQIGWPQLEALAAERGGAAFSKGAYDFGAVVGDSDNETPEGAAAKSLTKPESAIHSVLAKYVYREPTGEWIRTRDACIMKREIFNDTQDGQLVTATDLQARLALWVDGGSKGPRPTATNAHALLKGRVRMVQTVTYMPSKPQIFTSATRGDPVFNSYRPPERPFAEVEISDDDVRPFLETLDWVIPDHASKMLMLDWMSFIAQNPGHKIDWAPVLFSITQGVGKDTLLKVLRYGVVGEENMVGIAPARIDGEFNADWAPKQVVSANELPSFSKRDLYDKLKDYVASGVGSISVNPKGVDRYEVPNLQCWVFTTNKPDALALEATDRRFVILHAREEKMSDAVRAPVYAFFDWNEKTREGSKRGYHLAGEWLRRRAISESFSPFECGLMTDAKVRMRKETRPPLQEYLEDAISERTWPFNADLVLIKDVMASLPNYVTQRGTPSPQRVASELVKLGCLALGRPYLGPVPPGCSAPAEYQPKQMSVFAVRNFERYAGMAPPDLASTYWAQRRAAEAENANDGRGSSSPFDTPSLAGQRDPAGRQAMSADTSAAAAAADGTTH